MTAVFGATSFEPELEGDLFGHPRGLAYLIATETWERFSYYGMQTLLVLYMSQQLLKPGHVEHIVGFGAFRAALFAFTGPLSPLALASMIFGLYGSLVYVTPILGGLIADRWLGRTATVTLGAVLMAIGHFLMAFEASFLAALTCLLLGSGAFKGNVSSQIGELYAPEDRRRARAYQLFFLGINFGALFSPLVCGTLGERAGWHWGFGAAGIGMLVGLATYLSGHRWLPAEVRMARRTATPVRLDGSDRARLALLVALVPVLACAMIGNSQAFNLGLVWAKGAYDLRLFGFDMPVTWLQTLGSIFALATIVCSVAFWRWWAARRAEPSDLGKIALGAVLMAAAPLILAAAAAATDGGRHRISLAWFFANLLIHSVGYANLVPVTYSLFAAAAPARIRGTVMSLCLLEFFVSTLLAGILGARFEAWGAVRFWLAHAAISAAAAGVLLVVWRTLGRVLLPEQDGPEPSSRPSVAPVLNPA